METRRSKMEHRQEQQEEQLEWILARKPMESEDDNRHEEPTMSSKQQHRRMRFYTNSISNDAQEDVNIPIRTFDGKYPDSYSCEHALGDTVPTASMTIEYDFEFVMQLGSDLDDNIRGLEWSLLDGLVDTLRMDRCTPEESNDENGRALFLEQDEQEQRRLSYVRSVVKLSSSPRDRAEASEACQWIQYDDTESSCHAVRGLVSAVIRIDGSVSISDMNSFLHAAAKYEFLQDTIYVNHVETVQYIGDRSTAIPPFPQAQTDRTIGGSNGGSSDGGPSLPVLGVVLSASFVSIALLILIFAVRKRRSDDEDNEFKLDTASSGERDLECGSSVETISPQNQPHSQTSPAAADKEPFDIYPTILPISSSGSGDEELPTTDPNSSHPTVVENLPSGAALSSMPANNSTHARGYMTTSTGGSVASIAGPASVASTTAAVAHGLPPRPPVERKRSLKLKKRRKRKKKKKKVIMTRVNSKENIQEMATIVESEDEDSEYYTDSEYGSEYSTDDENAGFRSAPSSGRNTPIRGRPPRPSALSPPSELFPSDVFGEMDTMDNTIMARTPTRTNFDLSKIDASQLALSPGTKHRASSGNRASRNFFLPKSKHSAVASNSLNSVEWE